MDWRTQQAGTEIPAGHAEGESGAVLPGGRPILSFNALQSENPDTIPCFPDVDPSVRVLHGHVFAGAGRNAAKGKRGGDRRGRNPRGGSHCPTLPMPLLPTSALRRARLCSRSCAGQPPWNSWLLPMVMCRLDALTAHAFPLLLKQMHALCLYVQITSEAFSVRSFCSAAATPCVAVLRPVSTPHAVSPRAGQLITALTVQDETQFDVDNEVRTTAPACSEEPPLLLYQAGRQDPTTHWLAVCPCSSLTRTRRRRSQSGAQSTSGWCGT